VTRLRSPEALAQRATSVFFGTATGASWAPIPNLAVTATTSVTGVSTKVLTNDSGNYVFPNLAPGTATVSEKPVGFGRPK
jgi:hypothetical protein